MKKIEIAKFRSIQNNCPLVLGSATPSLDSYSKVMSGEYKLFELPIRANGKPMPEIQIVDMLNEIRNGNTNMFSRSLLVNLEECIKDKNQAMIFINRRGFSSFIMCRECGYVAKCTDCDVSLVYHKSENKLKCHYCGKRFHVLDVCPECGSKSIKQGAIGTEQVVLELKKYFPDVPIFRMDNDTTRNKNAHEKILSQFRQAKPSILVGTQMIAKGHDIPNVTLVGILAADLSLYADDYRAGERTFQLLTQAAGRAGRGREKGEVVIQPYSPDHYAVETAASQNYEAFYQEEIAYRKLMGYPPVEQLVAILISGEDEKYLEMACDYLKKFAEHINKKQVRIIGPTSPYVGKINDVYRRVLYLKHTDYHSLTEMKDKLEQYIEMNSGFAKLRIQFDFNPMNIF